MKRVAINLGALAIIMCGAVALAEPASATVEAAKATCTTSGGTTVTGDCCETTVGGGCRCGPCS